MSGRGSGTRGNRYGDARLATWAVCPARGILRAAQSMSFDSLAFLSFFLAVWLIARTGLATGVVLTAASVVYYSFAGASDTLLFGLVLVVNFLLSLKVRGSRLALIVTIVFNVSVLAFFKYRGLFLDTVSVAGSFESALVIPLGISFYIFQLIAYLVDLRRGQIPLEARGDRFLLFIGFFPQLVAGPIVRGHILLPQVKRLFAGTLRRPRLVGFALALCLLGLFKKVVLSDSIAPVVDDIFAVGPADAATAWLGAWLFGFQIYFDFSGYSDMAIGMALLLGVRLPLNFRTPYLARSPREFWQRWHITLSTWIRDYLYVSLGGSRAGGLARQTLVLVLVMGLAGLWHGANWTFVIWGLAWGTAIAFWRLGFDSVLCRVPLVGWAATMVVVFTLWVFFRSPDINFALAYLGTMWGAGGTGTLALVPASGWGLLTVVSSAALLGLHALERLTQGSAVLWWLRRYEGPFLNGLLIGLCVALVLLPKASDNPFIYFRF